MSIEDNAVRNGHIRNFILTAEIKDYDIMIDGKTFFDQLVKNDLNTYQNIQKTATDQGDDYTTGYLLDYKHFKIYC